jgi:hypothetical protein
VEVDSIPNAMQRYKSPFSTFGKLQRYHSWLRDINHYTSRTSFSALAGEPHKDIIVEGDSILNNPVSMLQCSAVNVWGSFRDITVLLVGRYHYASRTSFSASWELRKDIIVEGDSTVFNIIQ